MEEIMIRIRGPYDMHVHLRDGEMLKNVIPYTANLFVGGVIMGNLQKPVVTAEDAVNYKRQIMEQAPDFNPIMTVMLTTGTTPKVLEKAFMAGVRVLKYIPGNASTNSKEGVPLEDLHYYYDVLEMAQRLGMFFSGHWELPCDENGMVIPELEREVRAIVYLKAVVRKFPALRIIVEHATTCEMIKYVKKAPANVAATLTVHHAMLIYSDVCNKKGEIVNSFNYCKPIAKRADDRKAVIEAMVSGNPKFFFGSDSAPHYLWKKTDNPPAAGIFTAPVALSLLCQIFERNGQLDKLENFVSVYGPEFYGLPVSERRLLIIKRDFFPASILNDVKVFKGEEMLEWVVSERN
jgi:dihydroorotase